MINKILSSFVKKNTILIVGNMSENIDILSVTLKQNYKVKVSFTVQKSLQTAQMSPRPDLILLDVMFSETDDYQICKRLKADPVTQNIPLLFVTFKSEEIDVKKAFKFGAVESFTKPINPIILLSRVQTHILLANQSYELQKQESIRHKEVQQTRLEMLQRLGRAAELKDNESGCHVVRMSYYTRFIAESFIGDKQSNWPEYLFKAAPMHDIGKIGIPDQILLKKGRFDNYEWEIMRRHPIYGAEIIGEHESDLLAIAYEITLYHHERWDGKGYPYGLKKDEIPISARVAAIADVFDALTTERVYKKAWSVDAAVNYIKENADKQFDPALVPHFIQALPKMLEIKKEFEEKADMFSISQFYDGLRLC